jgi:amidase
MIPEIPAPDVIRGRQVGVHFAGRYAEVATLLRLAAQLEAAQPWFDRVPDL